MMRNKYTPQFIEMLLALLKANISLTEALHILSSEGIDPVIKETAAALLVLMKKGRSFSDSLAAVMNGGSNLNPLYMNLIRTSEMTGTIKDILANILMDLQRKQKSREMVISVLVYPLIVITAACIGTAVIFLKGIPLFVSAGLLSKTMLDSTIPGILFGGVFLLSSGVILFIAYYQIFGRDSPEYRIFYLLSFLLEENIPLSDSLSQCIAVMGASKYGRALITIRQKIESGVRFSRAAAQSGLFASFVAGWLMIADQNGNIREACRNIADFYGEKDMRVRAIAGKCIEPIVIGITGIYLLILIQAVILPILTHAGGIV